MPDDAFFDDEGNDRLLIRTAMAGLMPAVVLNNRERGRQAADLVERLRRSAHEVEAALSEVADGSGSRYVSTTRLRDAWLAAQRSDDPDTTHRAGAVLLRGLQAGLWVSRTHP